MGINLNTINVHNIDKMPMSQEKLVLKGYIELTQHYSPAQAIHEIKRDFSLSQDQLKQYEVLFKQLDKELASSRKSSQSRAEKELIHKVTTNLKHLSKKVNKDSSYYSKLRRMLNRYLFTIRFKLPIAVSSDKGLTQEEAQLINLRYELTLKQPLKNKSYGDTTSTLVPQLSFKEVSQALEGKKNRKELMQMERQILEKLFLRKTINIEDCFQLDPR